MSIRTADISFNENGTPVSAAFDDVYFSNDNGLLETRYVFIENNHLLDRWASWTKPHFVIAETGFGTGLNFLLTLNLFKAFREQHPSHPLKQLYFTSFEKFPIAIDDLRMALNAWPELENEAQALINHYPLPIEGCHRLSFATRNDNDVFLDLWFGDVNETLPLLPTQLHGAIDAWFLDGFAPSKNPDMWQENLFRYLALLSAPEGTFATFTAAGIVKRGLQGAGFTIEKVKGFGKKREMLRGFLPKAIELNEYEQNQFQGPRYWQRKSVAAASPLNISIIGGGLAGLNCAYSLLQHGHHVSIYEQGKSLAHGASGNKQGGFYPHLTVDVNLTSQFYAQSFLYARRRYRTLLQQGFSFEQDECGVLLLGFNEKQHERQQSLLAQKSWPDALINGVSQQEAENIAGVSLECGGLFMPLAGWINPASLVHALADACQTHPHFSLNLSSPIHHLQRSDSTWQLTLAEEQKVQTDVVIFATGHVSANVPELAALPFQSVRGQVEIVESQGELENLKTVLCHKGYLTPALHGSHALGATFVKNDDDVTYRHEEEHTNLATLAKTLPNTPWTNNIKTSQTGRASIRCTTPDHLPLFGSVPNVVEQKSQYQDLYKALAHHKYPYPEVQENMYLLSGLGSRGICTSPLLSEALACQISGKPLPLSQPQLNGLSPNRFLVRQLIRRKV